MLKSNPYQSNFAKLLTSSKIPRVLYCSAGLACLWWARDCFSEKTEAVSLGTTAGERLSPPRESASRAPGTAWGGAEGPASAPRSVWSLQGPLPQPAVSVSSALLGFADSPAPRRHAVAGEEEDGAPGPGPSGAPAGLVRARIAGLVSLPGLTDRETGFWGSWDDRWGEGSRGY